MLVAMSGYKTAGKDEAANVLIEEYGFKKVALADPVKALAYAINPMIGRDECGCHPLRLQDHIMYVGVDEAKKHPEVRRLYQAIGNEGGRTLFGENFWVDQLKKNVPGLFDEDTRYVLTDARFKNEGDFVQQNGGRLFWIDRPGLESDGHASESGELRDQANGIIRNESTIEELQEDVRFAMYYNGIHKPA